MSPQVAFILNKACECLDMSNLETAALYLKQALSFESNNSEAIRLNGVLYALKGDYLEALANFNQSIKLAPKSGLAYSNKGNALKELGRHEEAITAYDRSIYLTPKYHEAYSNKGNVLQELNQYDDAIVYYEKAISLQPNYHEAFNNKGNALKKLNRYDDAIVCYEKAIALQPNYHDAYINMGNLFQHIRRYDLAINCYERALITNDNSFEAWSGKGLVFFELEQIIEAKKSFKKAISINPDYVPSKYNLAHLELSQFNFVEGWDYYENRFLVKDFGSIKLQTRKLSWNGNSECKKLFVWAEQGIGDQILYASMFHDLQPFAQTKIVSLDKKLIPIFKRSFPDYIFINREDNVSDVLFDEQIPIGNLGKLFRNTIIDFKHSTIPYLVDDPIKTQKIYKKTKFNGKKTCGISWRSINKTTGLDKSIPFQCLYPLINLENIQFINLQYGDVSDELLMLKNDLNKEIMVFEDINLFDDVDDLLSLIAACDIVVTSSNSTAHLAGALGKETLLLVPYSAGKLWYWHAINGKSIWYPSLSVYKQVLQDDWSGPVIAAKAYLETYLA